MDEHYLATKKEANPVICDKMDGPWGNDAKWNKSEIDKYHVMSLICGI